MKKFTVTLFFGLLILALGATAYGQPKLDFKASGFIDVLTIWSENVADGNFGSGIYGPATVKAGATPLAGNSRGAGFNEDTSWLATRARLKFDAIMEKSLSGTFLFEIDSTRWGERPPAGDERNFLGVWNGDRGAMEIKNLYFDFGIPYFGIPVPMTVRAGLQPLSIRPNLLVYTDGMGISGGIDIAPVKIAPLWFKAIEGKDWAADDVDVYGLHVNAKVATFTLGGYGLWYNMNTFPLTAASTVPGTSPPFESDMYWFGAYADGKAGPVNINFDFIYDYGDVSARGASIAGDVDYRGWVVRAKVDYPWEKFNFGVVAHYATGADARDCNATGTPAGVADQDCDSYVVPPGSEAGFIYGESVVLYSSWVNRGTTGIGANGNAGALSRGPVGGTWMGKLYGSYKMTPWYKVTLAGLYIGDTTDNADTFGNAPGRDGNSIGWELDLYNEFQLYKNLNFVLAGGYMWAGSAMKFADPVSGVRHAYHNPWMITSALTYNF